MMVVAHHSTTIWQWHTFYLRAQPCIVYVYIDVVAPVYSRSYTCEAVRAIWWSTVGLHQRQLYQSKWVNVYVIVWVGCLVTFMCLFVCLFVFPLDISKTDAPKITKLDVDVVHHESWKPVYFGVKMQRSRSQSTKTLPAWAWRTCECRLLQHCVLGGKIKYRLIANFCGNISAINYQSKRVWWNKNVLRWFLKTVNDAVLDVSLIPSRRESLWISGMGFYRPDVL